MPRAHTRSRRVPMHISPLCSIICSFPTDMNYSRFLTSVSAARKASPIRVLSEYEPVLVRFS